MTVTTATPLAVRAGLTRRRSTNSSRNAGGSQPRTSESLGIPARPRDRATRRFNCWSSSFDVGTRSRSSARNAARNESSEEADSAKANASASRDLRHRDRERRESAGLLLPGCARGNHPLPPLQDGEDGDLRDARGIESQQLG